MIGEQELHQLIQRLRQYHRAVAATRAGLHQLQTPEAQDQLAQRLQAAYAIKAELEEEVSGFLLMHISSSRHNRDGWKQRGRKVGSSTAQNETNNDGRGRDLSCNRGGIRHPLSNQETRTKAGRQR